MKEIANGYLSFLAMAIHAIHLHRRGTRKPTLLRIRSVKCKGGCTENVPDFKRVRPLSVIEVIATELLLVPFDAMRIVRLQHFL
jgi:hypothetical protein